jgi:hypothetical protein
MRSDEYERRRRALEEQYQADLELIRAGHQAKLRALEMLWLASPEAAPVPPASPAPAPPSPAAASVSIAAHETLTSDETLASASHEPAVRGSFREALEAILPDLPEVFDKADIVRALGYTPTRPTLHRVLGDLISDRHIALDMPGRGTTSSRYRKLPDGIQRP